MFVMGGALLVTAPGFNLALRRGGGAATPPCGNAFPVIPAQVRMHDPKYGNVEASPGNPDQGAGRGSSLWSRDAVTSPHASGPRAILLLLDRCCR